MFKIQFCCSCGLLEGRNKCNYPLVNDTTLTRGTVQCCSQVWCCSVTAMQYSGVSFLRHGQTIILYFTKDSRQDICPLRNQQKHFIWVLEKNNIPCRNEQADENWLLSNPMELNLQKHRAKLSINNYALLCWPAVLKFLPTFQTK